MIQINLANLVISKPQKNKMINMHGVANSAALMVGYIQSACLDIAPKCVVHGAASRSCLFQSENLQNYVTTAARELRR